MEKSIPSNTEERAMGFKDKQKALDTLKNLDERDVTYQNLVVVGLVRRAKRTLEITRDKEKISNIEEAIQIFEDWLSDYKKNQRGKENLPYLDIKTVNVFRALAKKYDILDEDFYLAYKKEKGDYKALRAVKIDNDEITWDIERNRRLKKLIGEIKENYVQWYETDMNEFRGLPTKEHTQCILLGYSPDALKLKKKIPEIQEKFGHPEESEITEMEVDNEKKTSKRKFDEFAEGISDEEERGLSFQSEEDAFESIKSIEKRDAKYQYNAIMRLMSRAQKACMKEEQRVKNMKSAIEVFQKWITDHDTNCGSKDDFGYLNLEIVQAFKPLAEKYRIEKNGFLKVYEQEQGDFKNLRFIKAPESTITWDIKRTEILRKIVDDMNKHDVKLYESKSGLPTKKHVECIMWAFSYDCSKLMKLLPTLKEKLNSL